MVHLSGKGEELAGVLEMRKVKIPPNLVFVGHVHLPQAVAGWEDRHELQFHTHFIPEKKHLKDAGALAYVASLGRDSERSGTDEGEASDDVSDESKQDRTNSSCDIHPG